MSRSILVVEDDALVAHSISERLRRHGWHIQAACDVPSALRLLQDGGVDHVLCDLNLPGDCGLVLVRAAREHPGIRRVVVMSGIPDADFYLGVAQRAGAHAVLGKPFTEADLLGSLGD